MKRRELILTSSSLFLAGCGGGASKGGEEKTANSAVQGEKAPQLLLREQVQALKKKTQTGTPAPQEITPAQAIIEGQVLAAYLICTHPAAFTMLQKDASKDPNGPFKDVPDNVYKSLKTEFNKPDNQFPFAIQAFTDAFKLLSTAANSSDGSDDTAIYPDPTNPESCLSQATLDKLQGLLK